LALREDHLHLDATLVDVEQRFGNRRWGEAIGMYQYRMLGLV
jgi:hypothetical protein